MNDLIVDIAHRITGVSKENILKIQNSGEKAKVDFVDILLIVQILYIIAKFLPLIIDGCSTADRLLKVMERPRPLLKGILLLKANKAISQYPGVNISSWELASATCDAAATMDKESLKSCFIQIKKESK